MIAQKNVTHMFVGADAALVTTAAPATAKYLGIRRIGELLCDATALVAGDQFQVMYMNAAGKVVESPMLSYNNILSKSRVAPIALASQVSTIGYNGTDGDIVATNSGNYLITIGLRDSLKMTGNKRLYKFAEYAAATSAKKYDIAIGLVDSLAKNMSKDAFTRVVGSAVNSYAYDAAYDFDNDITVVKGSEFITGTATFPYHAAGATLAVGDYIKLGVPGTAPTVASPTYRVVELTSSTVTKLDRPVTSASGTYAAATHDAIVTAKADAEATSVKWGVKLTGNDGDAPFEVGKFGNNLITFSVGVSADFSTTEVRVLTAPKAGMGTYKDVAQLDWELQANRREPYRIAEHPVSFTSNASSADTYTYVYDIRFKDNSTETIGGFADSFIQLLIVSQNSTDANLATVFGL